MKEDKDIKAMLRLITGIAEDLLEQLINATEGFDVPISDEEIEEYEAFFKQAKEFLK